MKQIAAAAFALLSLSSVAEAHRLSGAATYYGGSDRCADVARLLGRRSTAAR